MEDHEQLWVVVGGSDKGGILVRSGEETTSRQYPIRLVCGARVRELELKGDRLHYEKVLGDGPDIGWISVKIKDKELVVRLPGPLEEGQEEEQQQPGVLVGRKEQAAREAEAAEEAAAALEAAEVAAEAAAATDAAAGMPEAREEQAPEEAAPVAEGADDLITVESMTAAGPPQELTEDEKQRQAQAEHFKAEMAMEAEAQERCTANESKENASDRGVFLAIATGADGGPGQGSKAPFVEALNASLMKIKQEFGKKDCPRSATVDAVARMLHCIVLFLNAIIWQRFRAGTAQRLERISGLFANAETGVCTSLKDTLKEERAAPDKGPSPVKAKLSGKLWQVLDILGQLPALLIVTPGRELEERIVVAMHRALVFYWHKVILPTCGLAKDRVITKEPEDPIAPDDVAPPESMAKTTAGMFFGFAFGVLFCKLDMLPDIVFFRPSSFSLRWRLFKTTPVIMTQLLCDLRTRFSEEDFQKRYKSIRSKAGPGDEEAIIQCALSVQSVVLPKYGFSGDIRGVMEMRGEVAALTAGLQDLCTQKVMHDIHRLLDYGEPLAKLPFTRTMENPRFAFRDRSAWLKHLNDHGFVVLAEVANSREVETAFDLLWSFIEQTDRSRTVRRADVTTWDDREDANCGWPAGKEDGIIHSRGIGQSQLLWHLRSLPSVKNAFAGVWGTEHLVPSFDGAGVFRPFGHKRSWRTKKTNWWHVDQAHRKRGLHCVQGLLTLTDATPATGGLVVVPGSHRFHGDLLSSHAPKRSGWDYIGLEANEKVLTEGDSGPRLVSARAGDLILWDSRTVHCNTLPLEEDQDMLSGESLLRAVAYICMTPAAWCSEKVCNQRAAAFKRGVTTSHWPHEFHAMDIDENEPPFALNKAQKELLSPRTEDLQFSAPKQGRISLLPEAKYRVLRQGGVGVYKSATTEWGSPVASLKPNTEVMGYPIGKWLRLGSWPRNVPLPTGVGELGEENELWSELHGENGAANFARVAEP